ncbi:hypothetical protein N0V82_002300 [Gnomoniopsis sp. IMI 355080]|nr:hypothetical protein N0V82_002300 [Gnomoniopsis sp. IMI 355080]
MESILTKIDEDLRQKLAGHSMRRMKLKQLDQLLEGHKDDVLKTYTFWLLEGFIANLVPEANLERPPTYNSQLQAWCDRLQRNYGFGAELIFDTLCDCTLRLINTNAVNRLHLAKIKENIHLRLFRPRGKKQRYRHPPPVEGSKVSSSLRSSDGHTLKTNDNEEYRKATTMRSNHIDVSGIHEPDLRDCSSDSDFEVEFLASSQRSHHHQVPPSSGSLLSEDSKPGLGLSDRTEQVSYDLKQKHIQPDTYEKKVPDGKFGASRMKRNKRSQEQPRTVEKPPDDYLCYRCEVPGHFLQDCPTNLDPSFDRTPVGTYKCMICGRTKAHLTSLCPENTDPKSLTQLRLRLGAVANRRLQRKDEYRPDYEKKEQKGQWGDRLDSLNDGLMNEDRRRAILELGDEDNDQLVNQDSFESRYNQAKRAYARQQSPQDDQDTYRYTFQPPKRVRLDDRKQESSRGHGHVPERQSCGKNSAFSTNPSELLAALNGPRADIGRLSYWDSGDQLPPAPKEIDPPRYRGPDISFSFNPMRAKKQPLAQESWSEDNHPKELKALFPYADSDWVEDMASFDIVQFFEEMDDLILSTASKAQAIGSSTKID